MRKFLISATLLASTVAIAAPAAAQWAPPVPQGYAYGYQGNYGQVRRLEARVDHIQRQIRQLDRRNILSEREARRLGNEARYLDQRINVLARNGFNRRDRQDIEVRIARLEQRIRWEANDGDRRFGRNGYSQNGYNQYDRDRDGRIDRYEDDRGRDHDGRGDRDDD